MKLDKFNEAANLIGGIMILAIATLTFIEVLARKFLGGPTLWTSSVSEYLVLGFVFLSAGYCFQTGGHVNVEILVEKVGTRWKKILSGVGLILSMVYSSLLAWESFKLLLLSIRFKWSTFGGFPIPAWILYLLMVLGCIGLIVTIINIMIKTFAVKNQRVV